MLINIRGTSGSGKSTIVRNVMALYPERIPHMEIWRKQPLYYVLNRPDGKSLRVIGHYSSACGGCDTIGLGFDFIYDLIHEAVAQNQDCLFEGLLLTSDVTRCVALKEVDKLIVVALTTTLEECLASIRARREARGKTDPLNPKNTESKFKVVRDQRQRFLNAGVDHRLLNREETFQLCIKEFALNTSQTTLLPLFEGLNGIPSR